MSEISTQPTRLLDTKPATHVKVAEQPISKGMVNVLAVLLKVINSPPPPIGPERQLTAVARTTEQMNQIASAMAQASKELMPGITRMTEAQLQSYAQDYVGGELTPFFAQLKQIEPSQRLLLKDNLKGLFDGCLDRWGDLNFDDQQSKIDPATGASYRSRVLGPLELSFHSSVEYADVKVRIQDMLSKSRVENTTPMAKEAAQHLIGKACEAGLNAYHEGKLRNWVEEETRDPQELERLRQAKEQEDKERLEALTDAMNARIKLSRGARPTQLVRGDVRRETGKSLDQVVDRLATFMPAARIRNKP